MVISAFSAFKIYEASLTYHKYDTYEKRDFAEIIIMIYICSISLLVGIVFQVK